MVGVCRHLDGDGGVTRCLAGDSDLVPADRHGGDAGITGGCGDGPGAGPGHGDGFGGRVAVQAQAAGADGDAARRLADGPAHAFGRRGPVRPGIASLGRKRGRVAARVGPAGGPAQGHGVGVVVGPGRRLGGAAIGQRPALTGHGSDPPHPPGQCGVVVDHAVRTSWVVTYTVMAAVGTVSQVNVRLLAPCPVQRMPASMYAVWLAAAGMG